jgi:soluble cytochrome b562
MVTQSATAAQATLHRLTRRKKRLEGTHQMKLRGRLLALAAGLVALVAVVGCGGSSGPSKAEFVQKADAICAQTNKAHPPAAQAKSLKARGQQAAEEVTIRKDLDTKLRDLDVPDSLKKDFDAYNSGTERVISQIDKAAKAAAAGNEGQYNVNLAQVDQIAVAREKTAIKLGFKTCGRKNPAQ